MERSGDDVTRTLAHFLVSSGFDDIPEPIRRLAKQALLNSVGAALGGAGNEVIAALAKAVIALDGPGPVAVLGRAERASVSNAAFLNGAAACVLDYDDTHFPTIMHPSATVAGPLFAMASFMPVSGRDFLHAFIMGFEAQARIGRAVSPHHYAHGFHITSTCGVFGSAVAVSRLLRLDLQQMIWAIGIASTLSAGMGKAGGFSSKSISVGNAAKNGLLAAFYARAGLDAPPESLDGRNGYCEVMSDAPDYGALSDGLGETWELSNNAYKAYPAGIVIHPVIDACLELCSTHQLRAEDIAEVTVYGNPLMGRLCGRPAVATTREAVVSIQHSVAAAIVDGAVGLQQYALDRVNDPQVQALRGKVRVVDVPAMPVGPIRLEVLTCAGTRLEAAVEHWRGSIERPLDDAALGQKVRELAASGAPHCDIRAVMALVRDLENVADVSALVGATRP